MKKSQYVIGESVDVNYENKNEFAVYGHITTLDCIDPYALIYRVDEFEIEDELKLLIEQQKSNEIKMEFRHVWGKKNPASEIEEDGTGYSWFISEQENKPKKEKGWFPMTKIIIIYKK
jgi:hypothetical protein